MGVHYTWERVIHGKIWYIHGYTNYECIIHVSKTLLLSKTHCCKETDAINTVKRQSTN